MLQGGACQEAARLGEAGEGQVGEAHHGGNQEGSPVPRNAGHNCKVHHGVLADHGGGEDQGQDPHPHFDGSESSS